ncbi:hypothetical protein EP331_15860 [bacterium]|nr:MAG: hypothetical protein EP331_15860 [bacterium]
MKKYGILLLSFMFISIQLLNAHGFRYSKWGMSKNEVKQIELSEIFLETDNLIVYQTELAGYKVAMSYQFEDNKLVKASYKIAEPYSQKDMIKAYVFFKNLLDKKYGKAEKSENASQVINLTSTSISLYELDTVLENLHVENQWNSEENKVQMALKSDTDKSELTILYLTE